VRISPQNAATLYALVAKNGLKNTQVVLAGLTPGGEGKLAALFQALVWRSIGLWDDKSSSSYSDARHVRLLMPA
jgi:hypothetical protein